jgi:RNA-splicing ligase RtcB
MNGCTEQRNVWYVINDKEVFMIEIRGKHNVAKVFTDELDDFSREQIENLCDQSFVEGSKIRLMPDVHAGAGCTIGTTMTITDKIVPNLVGVDIGCGMETMVINNDTKEAKDFDPARLDAIIHLEIPNGMDIRDDEHEFINKIDGSIICEGLGNSDWNYSSPHGAGRVMSRKKAFMTLKMEDYKKEMEGIYSTSVNEQTIDESPMAYKPMNNIIANMEQTAKIVNIIKPIYNFKSAEVQKPWKKKNL